MVEDHTLNTIAGVGAALSSIAAVFGGIYSSISGDISPIGAMIISAIGIVLLAIVFLSVDNRRKINRMEGDES